MITQSQHTPEEKDDNQNPAKHHDHVSDTINGKKTPEELKERLADEPKSLGVDLDGTNPGSNKHPMDPDQ